MESLYAEAVIEEALADGLLRLEYSLPGEVINACMEARVKDTCVRWVSRLFNVI